MNALPALLAGWAAIVLTRAAHGWVSDPPPLGAIVDAWAAAPGLSLAGAVSELNRIGWVAALALGWTLAGLGAGESAAQIATRRRIRAALGIPLGLGALSAAAAGLGFAGLLFPGVLLASALAGLLLGARSAWVRRGGLGRIAAGFRSEPVAGAAAFLAAAAIAVLLATLPDTHEDPLVYHWAAPEAFLRAHRIYPAVQHLQWQWPLGVEMLFAYGLAAGGVAAVKAATLVFLGVACAAAGGVARRLNPGATGWPAAGMVALAPGLAYHAWLAKNDPGCVAWWAAAALALVSWPARSRTGALVGGVLAGLCASTKLTSAFPLAGLAAWFLLRGPGWRTAAVGVGAALVALSPWPARDWLLTRDPFYPLGGPAFHALAWGRPYTQALHVYAQQVVKAPPGGPPSGWIAWRDAFADPGSCGIALAALSPLALSVALPFGAAVAAAAALGAFLAAMAERDFRFLLPFAPLLAAGGEIALLRVRSFRPRAAAAAWSALAALGAVHLVIRVAAQLPPDDWAYLSGRLRGEAYVVRRDTVEEDLRRWCRSNLPPSERILLTGSHRRFGFAQEVVSTHVVTMPLPWRWARDSRTPEELAKKWRQAGIGVVAHNLVSARFRNQGWFTGPPWTDRALKIYREFARRWLTEIRRSPRMDYQNGFFYVLRVERRPHAPAGWITVLPWTEAIMVDVRIAGNTGAPRATIVELARRALLRLPDVDDAVETAAYALSQAGEANRALALNRILAAHSFDGEIGWYELGVEESYLGRRKQACYAARRWAGLVGGQDPRVPELATTEFVNFAGARVGAGDISGACRLLRIALRITPDSPRAREGLADIKCGGNVR